MIRLARKHPRISIDPAVMVGKPCIKGTRMPVDLILRELVGGPSTEEVVAAHPFLTVEDIRAAQAFAADMVADEAVVPAEA
jgi:uncharacterized protein (DUF433 family)